MKKIIIIFLIFISTNLTAQEVTIFTDGFTNLNGLSAHSNVKITNIFSTNYLTTSNSPGNGYAISTNIVLNPDKQWYYLYFDYLYVGVVGRASFSIYILKPDDSQIAYTTNSPYSISHVTSKTIKLKATFSSSGSKKPILDFWKITAEPKASVSEYTPIYKGIFYGAPAPFKIGSSPMRFYYTFSKNCSVTLKIYDLNYRLVKTVQKDMHYAVKDNLGAVWDGKNGDGYTVLSGVYIAILEITNDDGTTEKMDPFSFAVVR